MKNKLLSLSLLLLFMLLIIFPFLTSPTKYTSTTQKEGRAVVSVFDKQENTPIQNATICILETQEYYQTNKLGSVTFSLPAKITNKLSFSSPNKSWEEYTLLIYKNGYYPHLHYGLKIEYNITTTGTVITLQGLSPNEDYTYTESYDFPSTVWSEKIISQYRK